MSYSSGMNQKSRRFRSFHGSFNAILGSERGQVQWKCTRVYYFIFTKKNKRIWKTETVFLFNFIKIVIHMHLKQKSKMIDWNPLKQFLNWSDAVVHLIFSEYKLTVWISHIKRRVAPLIFFFCEPHCYFYYKIIEKCLTQIQFKSKV